MVEDAQVGRRLARARWPLRAWGASAVAAPASAKAHFSIMLTFGTKTGAAARFSPEAGSGPRGGPVELRKLLRWCAQYAARMKRRSQIPRWQAACILKARQVHKTRLTASIFARHAAWRRRT